MFELQITGRTSRKSTEKKNKQKKIIENESMDSPEGPDLKLGPLKRRTRGLS